MLSKCASEIWIDSLNAFGIRLHNSDLTDICAWRSLVEFRGESWTQLFVNSDFVSVIIFSRAWADDMRIGAFLENFPNGQGADYETKTNDSGTYAFSKNEDKLCPENSGWYKNEVKNQQWRSICDERLRVEIEARLSGSTVTGWHGHTLSNIQLGRCPRNWWCGDRRPSHLLNVKLCMSIIGAHVPIYAEISELRRQVRVVKSLFHFTFTI